MQFVLKEESSYLQKGKCVKGVSLAVLNWNTGRKEKSQLNQKVTPKKKKTKQTSNYCVIESLEGTGRNQNICCYQSWCKSSSWPKATPTVFCLLQKKRKQASRDADSLSLCSLDINVSSLFSLTRLRSTFTPLLALFWITEGNLFQKCWKSLFFAVTDLLKITSCWYLVRTEASLQQLCKRSVQVGLVFDLCISLSFAMTMAYCVFGPSGALGFCAAALLVFFSVFLALCQQPIPSWAFPSLLTRTQDVHPVWYDPIRPQHTVGLTLP